MTGPFLRKPNAVSGGAVTVAVIAGHNFRVVQPLNGRQVQLAVV